MTPPLSTTGRHSLLAAFGAAASLVAAVVALALMGPGFVDFDGDGSAPAEAPAGGSLSFGGSGTAPAVVPPGGLSAGRASGSAPDGGSSPGTASAPASPGAGRVEQWAGSGGGINTAAARPVAPPGGRPDLPPGHGDPGAAESVARTVQEAGGAAGRASERLGSSASGHLSELNPFLGQAAERTGAVSGEGAREVGDATGGAVRGLVPPL